MPSVPSLLAAAARSRLVHFLVLGGALALAAPRGDDGDGPGSTIVIDAARVDDRVRAEQARRGRPLDAAERAAVVEELVDEEVLAREATRAGLAESDPVVRARLAERMRAALAQGLADPSIDAEALATAIEREAARSPERVRLALWFVPKERPDAGSEAEAIAAAVRREGAAGARGRGARPPIPDNAFWTEAELAQVAGPVVARALVETPIGVPSAPLPSAWGYYVILPLERRRAEPAEVRAAALRALAEERRGEDVAKMIARARGAYAIDVRGTVN